MRKWKNLLFAALITAILIVLFLAPKETTPRTPDNPTHANPRQFENCVTCHMPGGDGPEVRADHLSPEGKLRLDHTKCYMCHKPPKR
jgi:hypothetical protein